MTNDRKSHEFILAQEQEEEWFFDDASKAKSGSEKGNLVGVVEFVVHEAGDDAGFADGLIAQEHQLVLCKSWHWPCRHFWHDIKQQYRLLISLPIPFNFKGGSGSPPFASFHLSEFLNNEWREGRTNSDTYGKMRKIIKKMLGWGHNDCYCLNFFFI